MDHLISRWLENERFNILQTEVQFCEDENVINCKHIQKFVIPKMAEAVLIQTDSMHKKWNYEY